MIYLCCFSTIEQVLSLAYCISDIYCGDMLGCNHVKICKENSSLNLFLDGREGKEKKEANAIYNIKFSLRDRQTMKTY